MNLHIGVRIFWVITIFLSPGLGSVYNNEAQSYPLPLFSVHVYSYCLFMDTAGSPCMCDIMNSASWLRLIRAALLSVCCQHHQPPVWEAFLFIFLFKSAQMSIHQGFTSRTRPCGVVSSTAQDRLAQCVLALSGFHYTRQRWEAPASGDINAFITDM